MDRKYIIKKNHAAINAHHTFKGDKKMKKLILLLVSAIAILALAACGDKDKDASATKVVKIGVTGSDGAQWPILQKLAEKEGIEIKLIEFSDYTLPNKALAAGDIDINSFQHIAFLSQFAKEHKADLVPIGSTALAPMGIYSDKLNDITDIEDVAKVAIPDDPSNQARALKLLESAGLITLSNDFGLFGDPSKVIANPKKLDIIPMVAQQTPRVLPDVAISVINNGVAGQAGFDPVTDPIYLEDANNENAIPYVNVFAARATDADNKTYLRIVELYHTEEIAKAIEEDTNGGSIITRLTKEDLINVFKGL
jgi:D-methionine transport system substrate-binding protein